MAITKDDIKLFKSERMTDDSDGGGLMTAAEIVSDQENNVFPDLSEVDRARGAVFYRKLYAAVVSPGTEALYGAHVLIDKPCSDSSLTALLTSSAGVGELKSNLIAALNGSAGNGQFYGIKPLAFEANVGDRVVQLSGLSEQLIPPASLGGNVSGTIRAAEDNLRRCRPYVITTTDTTGAWGDFQNHATVLFTSPCQGVMTAAGGGSVGNVGLYQKDGREFFGNWSSDNGVPFNGPGYYAWAYTTSSDVSPPLVYTPTLAVDLAGVTENFTYSAGGSTVRTLVLANPPAEASEVISWTGQDGQPYSLINAGPPQFITGDGGIASCDRVHGVVVVSFAVPPADGGTIAVTYAKKADAAELPAPTSVAADGGYVINLAAGMELGEAQFNYGEGRCRVVGTDNAVRYYKVDATESLPKLVEAGIVGAFDPVAKRLYLIGGTAGPSGWVGVQVKAGSSTSTGTKATATIETGIRGDTLTVTGQTAGSVAFSATADVSGNFSTSPVSGHYDSTTGQLKLTFSTSVKLSSLGYTGSREVTSVAGADIAGVNPSLFDPSGRVPIVWENALAVVHNTQSLAPVTVSNGQTVALPRDRLADVRVFGSDGAEIFAGFSVDRVGGSVTFSNVSGYAQPVTISHRVEDMAVVQTVGQEGSTVSLTRPLTHAYPAGSSYLSTALLLDDLQARTLLGFPMASWSGDWGSSGSGTILADFNQAAHPITVTDDGAITEDWACIFTNTTQFRVVGRQVGEVVQSASTATNCAPINPATGKPYFTIPAAGWGTGWSIGNVFRFTTKGAASPFWELLSLAPSDPSSGQLVVSVTARGSIDATS